MDQIAIIGGARLDGEIAISGAKNSAIKLMAAGLLTDEPLRLTNMPRLADTRFLGALLRRLGTDVQERDGPDGAETVLNTPEIVSAIAAYDPEIVDLAACLAAMGARIEGAGTPVIRILGVERLGGATYAVTPDRIETGTYALAAAMAGGEVRLTHTRHDFIEALLEKM